MLDVLDVHTYYGDSHVLQGVTLRADKGTVTAVLGRNGVEQGPAMPHASWPDAMSLGIVALAELGPYPVAPHQIAAAGLSLVPQGRRVFKSLTVREDVRISMPTVG